MNPKELERIIEKEYQLPEYERDDLIRELIWTHNRLQSFHPDCDAYVKDKVLYTHFKLRIKVLTRLTGFEITDIEMDTRFARPKRPFLR